MNTILSKESLRQLRLVRSFVHSTFYDTISPLFSSSAPGLTVPLGYKDCRSRAPLLKCRASWCWRRRSLVWVAPSSITDGFNDPAVIGRRLPVLLLNSPYAGLIFILAGGVFVWSSKARNPSEPVLKHFTRVFLVCFTTLSAFPFD